MRAVDTTIGRPYQGVELPPGTAHQLVNRSTGDVEMLVIPSPRAHGDREDL